MWTVRFVEEKTRRNAGPELRPAKNKHTKHNLLARALPVARSNFVFPQDQDQASQNDTSPTTNYTIILPWKSSAIVENVLGVFTRLIEIKRRWS